MHARAPDAFPNEDDDDARDEGCLATEFGWIDTYRVVYHQLRHNWDAYALDLDGVIATGRTREEVERHMREAIPLHLAALAEDRLERPWLYESVSS